MSFGAPPGSALQYPVTKPALTQAAEAAAAAPQDVADKQAKLAESQTAKLESDLKGQQANDAILSRLAAVPGIEKSPYGQKALTERLKTLGVEVPKNELGQIDMKAIQAMITPPMKPWEQWTPAEKNAVAGEDPKLRSLPPDAPEAARTMPANVPITEKGIEALMKPVQTAEAAIGKGTGNMQGLQAAAISAYKTLSSRGADTSVVDSYLNPEHTALSDDFKTQQAGQLVDAQIDKMHKLGIYQADENKWREQQIAEKKREFDNLGANQKARLSVEESRMNQQASLAAQRLTLARENLQARWTSVSNAKQNTGLRATALGANIYEGLARNALTEMGNAQTKLTQTTNVINTMSQNPKMRNSPLFKNLVDQASDLQDFIQQNGPALQAQAVAGQAGLSNVYSSITGNQAQPMPQQIPPLRIVVSSDPNRVPAPPPGQAFGSQAQQYAKGAPVPDAQGYKFTGAKNADGTYDAVGPDGKIRKWRP